MAQQDVNHKRIPQRPSDHMTGFIHDSKLQPNHSTTATFESSSSQTLSANLVYTALREVILEHPRLSVAYVRSRGKSGHERHAVQLNQLDLRQCVAFVDSPDTQVNDILESEESTWFDVHLLLPQWRLVVLNGKYVTFLFNHLCCDGLSSMAFYRSFVSALNSAKLEDSDLASIATMQIPDMPLVESPQAKFERDTPMICMLGNSAKTVFRTAMISLFYYGRRHLFHDYHHAKYYRRRGDEVMDKDDQNTCRPKYETITLGKETMKDLIALCKEQETSFTGLLHTLIIGVLSTYIYPHAKFARSRIAVSYRRYTGTPTSTVTDEAGNIYWGARLKALRGVFDLEDLEKTWEIIWSESKKYKHFVADDLNNEKKHAKINGHAKFMGQTDEKITKTMGLLGQQRHRTIEISNLGVFSESDDANDEKCPLSPVWRITGYSFNSAPSHSTFASSVNFGIVSMKGGECVINMGYDGNGIDRSLMVRFADILQQKLVECGGTAIRYISQDVSAKHWS